LLGEGRTGRLSGYIDGFNLWKTLFEDGVQGVIRGDECFGRIEVSSLLTIKRYLSLALCSDISNLKDYKNYGFSTQEFPQNFLQKKGETLAQWRDRLYHEFRLPTILSPLSDLKLSYVEVITPLLSRTILQQVRQLPDHLRNDRFLFKKIVASMSPKVDFATNSAGASLENILMQKKIVNVLKEELSSKNAKSIFPTNFLDYILKGIKSTQQTKMTKSGSFSLKASVKKFVPIYIKNVIRDNRLLPSVDHNILAFRVFLISKMNAILNDDSNLP